MTREEYKKELEEAYGGWPMKRLDITRLCALAKQTGSGKEVVNLLKVWSHEVERRPVPLDEFFYWRAEQLKPGEPRQMEMY